MCFRVFDRWTVQAPVLDSPLFQPGQSEHVQYVLFLSRLFECVFSSLLVCSAVLLGLHQRYLATVDSCIYRSCVRLLLRLDFWTAVKYFKRNLRLPFTAPLVAVSGPSIGIGAD